jgi:hypothetical protein
MSNKGYLGLAFVMLGIWTAPARGDLIVTVGSASLAPGETGALDVSIRSDGTDYLQAFGVRLRLDAPSNGLLRFTNPPSNAELLLNSYAFFGNSDAALNGSVSFVSSTVTTDDTYDGADFTADLGNVTLTSADRLLVRLDVTALNGATPGTFHVDLLDSLTTFFDADANLLPFLGTSGTVTVTGGVTAVPEPGTMTLFGLGWTVIAAMQIRKRLHGRT